MAAVPVARTARTVMRDVAVLLRGEHRRLLSAKLDMADVAFDVLLETGILISPLPIWRDEWEHPENHANPALLRNIGRKGIRLCGRQAAARAVACTGGGPAGSSALEQGAFRYDDQADDRNADQQRQRVEGFAHQDDRVAVGEKRL